MLALVAATGPTALSVEAAEADAARPEPGRVLHVALHPFAATGEQVVNAKVPLLEIFTATWCPPCAPADNAVDRLLSEESPGLANGSASSAARLAVLAYHPWPDPSAEDRLGIPEGEERMRAKYDAFWFPSVYVDGVYEDAPETRSTSVDAGMEEVLYASYRGLVGQAGAAATPVRSTSTLERGNASYRFDVALEGIADVDAEVWVQPVLWEDEVRFAGSNGVEVHRMVVRDLLPQRVMAGGITPRTVWTASWSDALPAGVREDRAGLALIVETRWGEPPREPTQLLVFGAGVAAAAVVVIALGSRAKAWAKPKRPGGPT